MGIDQAPVAMREEGVISQLRDNSFPLEFLYRFAVKRRWLVRLWYGILQNDRLLSC